MKKKTSRRHMQQDDEKKEAASASSPRSKANNDKKERKFYVTKETIAQLNGDDSLLKTLRANFEAIKAELTFKKNQIVIQQVHLDNERVLKMVQEVIGLAYSEAEFNRLVEELASIEHPRKDLLADPAQTFSNFLATTEKGAKFIKHSERDARVQWFSIKGDRLYWRDKEKGVNHHNRSMEMKSIVRIK